MLSYISIGQIIFSVVSGGNTSADMTIIVDLDGAVKASEIAGDKHFIMVSTCDGIKDEAMMILVNDTLANVFVIWLLNVYYCQNYYMVQYNLIQYNLIR